MVGAVVKKSQCVRQQTYSLAGRSVRTPLSFREVKKGAETLAGARTNYLLGCRSAGCDATKRGFRVVEPGICPGTPEVTVRFECWFIKKLRDCQRGVDILQRIRWSTF